MKWMTMDERAEWHAILDQALDAESGSYTERARRVLASLRDARQAHRPWAEKLIEDAVLKGLASALRYRSDTRDRLLVALPKGRSAERKARRGVRHRAADGTIVHQQKLLTEMTWDEAIGLLDGLNRQIASLSDSRTMVRKLNALRDLAPDSSGPGDAARSLGTSIEEVLAA